MLGGGGYSYWWGGGAGVVYEWSTLSSMESFFYPDNHCKIVNLELVSNKLARVKIDSDRPNLTWANFSPLILLWDSCRNSIKIKKCFRNNLYFTVFIQIEPIV